MANLLDDLHLRADLEAYDEAEKKRSPNITDYLRALATGYVGDTARGLGELLEKGGIDYGRRMRQAGDEFEFDQTQAMSPGGRRAFTQPVFTENKDSLLGLEPNPEGAWGPTFMQAARSAPQMVMMAAPAAPVAGALRAIPAVARAVEAGGATGKAADVLTTGLPFGAAEGAQAGLTNAAQTRSKIEGMKHEDLLDSPEYRTLFDKTDASLSEGERSKLAKDELAARAAQEVFLKTLPWTGTIGAATGGGAPGVLMRGGGRGAFDLVKSVAKGAGVEAGQEFPQSGGEQYFQNVAERRAVPTQDPWEDVLGQAAGGAAVGAVTGAPIGAGHAIMGRPEGAASPVDRLVQIARSMRAAPAQPAAAPAPLQPGAAAPAAPRVDTAQAARTVQAAQAAAMAPTPDDPVAALQALPEAERQAVSKDWPKMELGAPTQFQVPGSPTPISGRFALAEADSLVASHNPSLQENPAYPKALQPRDRTAAGYELQVAQMSKNLQPAMLGASPSATDGAPIVGPDGVIESGNGRWIALERAYSEDKGAQGKAYRDWLEANAPSFGLKPEQIQAMKKPILVRERTTPINRAEFARAANAPTTAQMGPLDQAKADAQRMGDLSGLAVGEDGNLFVPQNQKVVRGFFARLPITEQTGLVDKEGRISQTGQRRFLNAVIVRAYGEHSPAVMRLVESVNPDLRGLLGGLTKIAPMVAKARDAIAAKNLADRDLTGLIVGAVDELIRLKSEGKSVADELAQAQMFTHLPEGTMEVLSFLDANARSPAKISQFVLNYLGELARYGQPGQNDMFGAPAVPGAPDLIRRAQEMTREQTPGAIQPGVEPGAAAAASAAPVGGTALPEGAVGDLGAAPGPVETGKPAGGEPSPAEVEAKAAALKAEIEGNAAPGAEKPAETAQKAPETTLSQKSVPEGEQPSPVSQTTPERKTTDIQPGAEKGPVEAPQKPSGGQVDELAHEAATSPKNALPEPTQEQKEAGNYQLGHLMVSGLDISIENPEGSIRKSKPGAAVKWETKMRAHYGYIKGVSARAPDKEHVDVFVKPGTSENFTGNIFVVDQNKADGSFDEPKVMIGWPDEAAARAAYLENYQKGWESRIRGVTTYSMEQFKAKLEDAAAFLKPQGEAHAEKIRSDQGQVGSEGRPGETGEAKRGEDLQQPAETGAGPGDKARIEAPSVGAYRQLANWVAEKLAKREKFSNEELTAQAAEAFGGTAAAGRFSPRDAYDAMELGVNLMLEKGGKLYSPEGGINVAKSVLETLRSKMELLPTQTKRTNEQIEYQQFSTPPTLAYLAAWVGSPRAGESVLEPSAGTGDLAIFAKIASANVTANEIAPRRADILKELGFEVTREDAEQINNVLPATIKPTLILMNPPFSSAGGRIEGQRNIENGIRHLDQAWARLEPGGRMVALMGENFGGPAASRRWLAAVRQIGEVRALITISGKEYAKYGTTFGTSLMVLDKTGKSQAGTTTEGAFQTVAEALTALEAVRNERSEPERPAGVPEGERVPVEQAGGEARPGVRGEALPAGPARTEPSAAPARPAAPAETAAKGPAPGEEGPGQAALPFEPAKPGQGERGAGAARPAGGEPETAGLRGPAPVELGGPGAATGEQPAGVTLEKQEKKEQAKLTGEIFEAYTPAKVKIPGAKPHISDLVESAAMSSVEPPDPTYTPNLPDSVVKGGKLSDAQLEAVVYAGQAHQSFLPDGMRRGFFIGDGTGVGKGREISAILLDNLRQGRKKAVWVSEKQGLIRDAQRDYGDTGGQPTELFPQAKVKASDPIERQSGILFTTYSTLRSSEKREATEADQRIAKTRVKQLTDWLGPDFDGVIIFDESHNMQSAMKQKGKRGVKDASLQALAGLELQRVAPKARVVYSSATGATNVANLGYAQRLGLWGEQTAFADAPTFVNAIDSAGVSAMELVARDLKQMGLYIARALSFKGVSYERVTHELSPVQRAMYDRMADGWQTVLKNINEALEITGANESGAAKAAAMSRFWGAQQRFFNQVITSMQMPTVLERIDEDLKRGDAVVLQLVNTMEAELDRKLALVEEDADLQDLDLTPRDALIQMVQKAFPVQEFHTITKDGAEVSVPVLNSEGNPVLSKQAIAMREALIKDLQDIKVPEAPLDMVLKKFGTDTVAEVTGRSTRIVPAKDEQTGEARIIQEKRTASAARADADAFMADKKRILIFSDAGGTGYSFHSDRTKENQRRRQHYLIQPGWRADKAVQGFGRTHRSNEANQPNYKLAETNLKAQKRFISSVARRLDQLGALTKGQRQASGQQLFDEKDNLEGVYAGRAIRQLIYDSYHGNEPRVPFAEMIEGQMGLNLRNPETGVLSDNKLPDVPQFLNRLLSLKIAAQDAVFDAFFERMESMIEIAKQRNELDVGVQSLGAMEVVKQDEQTVYTDERTGAETKILRLNATYPRQFSKWADVKDRLDHIEAKKDAEHGIEGYWISTGEKTSGRPFAIYRWGTETTDRGGVEIKYQAITPMGVRYGVNAFPENAEKSTRAQVGKLWDDYIAKQTPTFDRIEHLLTGTILPVWDRMHGQFVRVVQTETKDGERLIGRWIAPASVETTLKAFGMSEVAKMTPEQIRSAIMDDNKAVVLANGWTLMRTKKAGEMRLEIVSSSGYGNASIAELERYGAFTEIDGWKQRTYLPVWNVEGAGPVLGPLERLLKVRPAADIIERPKSYRAEQEGADYQLEQKRKPPAKLEPGEIRDLFAIDPVTENKAGAGVIETLVVTPVQKGTLHIGFDKIDTPEKAAHVFANLRKHPREYFNILMLDENDKPIAAAELFSGTVTQTSVYPREVTTLAYQTPGARKIWFAHVHPSGVPEPSHADELLTRSLATMFGKDIGIELMGHIIIAGTKARAFYLAQEVQPPGTGTFAQGLADKEARDMLPPFDIPPASRKFAIPLMERMIRKNVAGPKEALNSPRAVRDFIRKLAPGQDGLLWLDAQHRVQGWQPMTLAQMGNMRTGDIRTGAAELFRRIGRNNPAAAIAVVHGDADMPIVGTPTIDKIATALRGLKSMLALMDVQVLDGFIVSGRNAMSLSERGVMQDTPKYSVAPRGGRAMTARQVQESLDRIAEQWNNAPAMRAVGSEEELPDRVRTKASAEGAKGRVQAVFDPVSGVMHVVAPAVGSVQELQFVVMHEVMGHYGLRGAFGEDLDAALQYLWTNNPRVRAKTAEASQRWGYSLEDRKLDAIEEAVAELAAEGFKFNGIRQFFAAVQSWLRLHGMGELADWLEGLTDAELTSVLTMSRAYVVDGGMHFSGQGDAALSAAGPTWYSALRRHVDAMNVNNAGKEHWQRELEAAVKSGKIKRDEVEWSGLNEWLDAQIGKIAKGDVVNFLGQNGVQVTETVLGGGVKVDATSTIDQLVVELDALGYTVRFAPEEDIYGTSIESLYRRSDGKIFFPLGEAGPEDADRPFSELPENVRVPAQHLLIATSIKNNEGREESATRHSSWQLPGGKNYRELLLTLPAQHGTWLDGSPVTAEDLGTEHGRAAAARVAGYSENTFRSSHFDQPNILAHIRFNERTDAEGKRVLFIEELQSDWAEKGRKEGFSDQRQYDALKLEQERMAAEIKEKLIGRVPHTAANARSDEATLYGEIARYAYNYLKSTPLWYSRDYDARVRSLVDEDTARKYNELTLRKIRSESGRTPLAAFVGKTESWVALALKRMIRYAAENGFERVAWTRGEQQTDRYSLEAHLKEIRLVKTGEFSKMVNLIGVSKSAGAGRNIDTTIHEDRIAEFIGDELAGKLQAKAWVRDTSVAPGPGEYVKRLTGLDVKIGGQGMRAFYDKIVPNVANDVLKKLGGERVKTSNIPNMEKDAGTWAIVDSTDEGEGQVLETFPNEQAARTALENSDDYNDGGVEVRFVDAIGAQPGFDITPALRESVMRGLPLFAVAQGEHPAPDTPRFAVADPALSDQERANAILAQQTNSIRPLESLFKGATEVTRLPKLTGFLYDKLVEGIQKALPESAKAGLIDKYGVPEYVQDRFAETIGRERQQLRETANLLDRMPVTREEARVAYQWLNQNAAGGDEMLNGVSLESKETLQKWKEWAHQMQGEAVRLGQLDAETAERNEYAYTHRSYLKYETAKDKKSGAGSIRILGDQYRTRGLTDEINTEDLAKWNPQWWERMRGKEDIGLKGKMFLKLEKRVGSKEGMAVLPGVEEIAEPGRVTRRVYWPADQAVPQRFSDYDLEGTWEARWVDGKTVTLWRDFTPEERKAMGEIDDARYAIAKTSQLMIHDIEVGKLLEWIANHEARPEARRDAEIVEANESLRKSYRPGTWVKVPESNAPGTKVAKYGKLAGLYVPGPIWNEIRQVVNQRYKPLGETYDQLLRLWKISKTALSPAVHMNNIMANVVMAEWQDLTAAHMAKAFRVMFVKDPAHKIILDKFEDAGGSVGMWTLSEIQKSQMEPLLAQLEREAAADNPEALINAAAVIQALQAGRYRQAADMVEELGPIRGSKAVLDKMVEVYQGEDQIFRLAAFLKAKEDGATDTAAGKFARESFLDYHITAPWINIMRTTAFPFVAFTYRALPLLAETMAKKPWKMLKFAALAGALDALGYALSGGDEDRERKLLPEEKSGSIWGYSGRFPFTQMEVNLGVSPKLIRMPWNDQFGSPVFLDIRRFVPLGDIVDVGQIHSAMPLLPTMMPGGPLSLVAELVANRSFFTGKEIVRETDTDLERTKKLAAYVYQWAIPNIALVPGSYSFLSIKGAAAGETDVFGRERSVAQAAGSALGVRLASYPEDLGRQQVLRQLAGEKREIGENISALRRQFQRGALDREEFESKMRDQLEKRIQFETQARRRLSAG